jgi:hypothetical protein
MHKNGRIPTAVKRSRPPVNAFGTLIKQHVPTLQDDFVGVPLKILDK